MCFTVVAHSKLEENKGPFFTMIHSYTEMNFSTPHTKIPSELQTFCPIMPFINVTKTAISILLVLDSQRICQKTKIVVAQEKKPFKLQEKLEV